MTANLRLSAASLVAVFFLNFLPVLQAQHCKYLVDSLDKRVENGQMFGILQLAMLADSICRSEVSQNDTLYAAAVNAMGNAHAASGQFAQALTRYRQAADIIREKKGRLSKNYADALGNVAFAYEGLRKFQEALTAVDTALEIARQTIGKNHLDYGGYLQTKASILHIMGKLAEARSVAEESVTNSENNGNPNVFYYFVRLNRLAGIELALGDFPNATVHMLKAKETIKSHLGERDPNYLIACINYGALLYYTGKYRPVEPILEEVLPLLAQNPDANALHGSIAKNNLGIAKLKIGKLDEALALLEEVRQVETANPNRDPVLFTKLLLNISTVHLDRGDAHLAYPLLLQAREVILPVSGKENPEYLLISNNLALCCSYLGNEEKAYRYARESVDLALGAYGKNYPGIGLMQQKVALLLWNMGRRDEAMRILQDAVQITEKQFGKDNYERSVLLVSLAKQLQRSKHYRESKSIVDEALKTIEKTVGKGHPQYIETLLLRALLNRDTGKKREADQDFRLALAGAEALSSGENLALRTKIALDYADFLKKSNLAQAFDLYRQAAEKIQQQTAQNFSVLSGNGREAFAQTAAPQLDGWRSFAVQHRDRFPQIPALLFDGSLADKGQLLASATAVSAAIRASADSILLRDFAKWHNNEQLIASQYSRSPAERLFSAVELDSIARDADLRETLLTQRSTAFRQARQKVVWQDVRKQLLPNEAAIEFISFRSTQDGETLSDSVLYCALVLRPDFDAPRLVWLFEEKQLVKILNQPGTLKNRVGSAYYDTDKLYQLLWKPLEAHLGTAHRIWYAPDGLLHSIAFPAISRVGRRTIAHDFELFSLGSTRELVGRDPMPAPKMGAAALFGGARYDADSACLRLRVGEVPPNLLASANIPNDQKGDCRPAKFDFLPWSYREVVWLDSLFRSQGMTTQLHTNCAASEEAVLETGRNSENAPDILHISIHALYCDTASDRAVRPGREADFAANPLLGPRLALSGINRKLAGGPPYEGLEDGELFANDIKDLLLTNTDLVVLSACGTGLGSIRSGEGVFGMQRAFKLAGARHVLVSLWDVKDKETHDLMQAFYSNWFGGMDIREAFLAAQRKMAQEGLHPYYWAGWVLI